MNTRTEAWQRLTPGQRLWVAVFGIYGLPRLDERKVLAIVDSLPPREAETVKLRFGFKEGPLTLREIGERLSRADKRRQEGVSREIARLELLRAIRRLKHPKRRQAWEEARKQYG